MAQLLHIHYSKHNNTQCRTTESSTIRIIDFFVANSFGRTPVAESVSVSEQLQRWILTFASLHVASTSADNWSRPLVKAGTCISRVAQCKAKLSASSNLPSVRTFPGRRC